MKNILKSGFIIFAAIAISALFTNSYFTDRESIQNNLFQAGTWQTGGNVVINEVYYDVDGNHGVDGGTSQNDEWIELYNPGSSPVNLQNWTITDNYSTVIIHPNQSISAHGFALLSKSANTWTFWGINPGNPGAGIEVISLGQFVQLANGGDRVILKDASNNIIDQMSYGSDHTIFTLSGVAEGHSLERNPIGFDTDQPSDFIDKTTPTPGF